MRSHQHLPILVFPQNQGQRCLHGGFDRLGARLSMILIGGALNALAGLA
jgi:hypothetical protein